jgi:hypothetical protein
MEREAWSFFLALAAEVTFKRRFARLKKKPTGSRGNFLLPSVGLFPVLLQHANDYLGVCYQAIGLCVRNLFPL